MTHVVLSLPAIIIAVILIGIPLNWILGGTRTALQRIAIAIISVPATVVLAVALFTFNALVPETYAALLRFADWIWQGSLDALSASGDTIPGARSFSFWHIAHIQRGNPEVRFRIKSGHLSPRVECLLMTQSGHSASSKRRSTLTFRL
jgi:hypothetical protein